MKLSIGIVGLPNVGKSTLFKLLTSQEVHIANYPFATIDPNVGVVSVPDERVEALAKLSGSKKKVPAVVEFYDIAGLVKGANQGEGLGNQFLTHIRDTSAVCFVLRCFGQSDIVHVEGSVDPVRDYEILKTELVLKDLETVERRIKKAEADARTKSKEGIEDLAALTAAKTALERGVMLIDEPLFDRAARVSREINLLTAKPRLFLLNGEKSEVPEALLAAIGGDGSHVVVANLVAAPKVDALIRAAYATLGLMSFFTTGEDETRAWTIERGARAPEAAGVIHTDFESKFIRAEVVSYADLIAAGGWNQAKQRGKLRLEGKEYIIQDGDVMVIRHGA
jgi:hypothetical protein